MEAGEMKWMEAREVGGGWRLGRGRWMEPGCDICSRNGHLSHLETLMLPFPTRLRVGALKISKDGH